MNKLMIINNMADVHFDIPKKIIRDSVNCIIDELQDAFIQQRNIEIRRFGSFRLNRRSSNYVINPKTGEQIKIENSFRIVFHPSKKLKNLINE